MRSAVQSLRTLGVAISHFVETFNQVASLLKLDREEEGSRDIDTANVAALLREALVDLVLPEIETALIGHAVKEVKIVLAHVEVAAEIGIPDRVWPVDSFITVDCYDHR